MGHNKRLLLFRVQECGPALHCWPYPTTDISQFGALLNPIVSSASTSHLKFQQPLQTTGVFLEGGAASFPLQSPSITSPATSVCQVTLYSKPPSLFIASGI